MVQTDDVEEGLLLVVYGELQAVVGGRRSKMGWKKPLLRLRVLGKKRTEPVGVKVEEVVVLLAIGKKKTETMALGD
ncbi:hypothetical protein DKX38_028226 [Salix brachista]|uniref:Uncharacterized protein n=1 Tax=Salix brachista TaxID=2182728 RepID=A0A5N5J8M1_9ROSI|nr:hypothetical protein DKX38_028226 [Salix brachista]